MGTDFVRKIEQADDGQRRESPREGSSSPVEQSTWGSHEAEAFLTAAPIRQEPRGLMKHHRSNDDVAKPGGRPATRNERAGREGEEP